MTTISIEKYFKGSKVFSITEVKGMFGFERGRVESWVRGDFIACNTARYSDKRTQTVFTHEQLYSLALFRLLVDSGFDRKRASVYNRYMVAQWEQVRSIGYQYMMIDFESEYLAEEAKSLPHSNNKKDEQWRHETQKLLDENPLYEVIESSGEGDNFDISKTNFPMPKLFGSAKEFGDIFSEYDLITVINVHNLIADVDKKVSDLE